jgi:hypothetical protein
LLQSSPPPPRSCFCSPRSAPVLRRFPLVSRVRLLFRFTSAPGASGTHVGFFSVAAGSAPRSWFSRVPASNEFFFAVTDLLIVSLSVAARVDSGSFCRRQFSASAHCSFQLVISLRRSLRDSHSPPLKGLGSARQSVPAVLVREGFAARQGRRRSLFASGRGFHDLRPGFIFPSWL